MALKTLPTKPCSKGKLIKLPNTPITPKGKLVKL